MSDLYILDEQGQPVPEPDVVRWSRWFHSTQDPNGPRRVALFLQDGIRISTVFLGIDHRMGTGGPPVLWETLVTGGEHDEHIERYTSREAALAGHERWVAKAKGDAP